LPLTLLVQKKYLQRQEKFMTSRRTIPAVFILLFAVALSRGQSLSTPDNDLSVASEFDKHQNPAPPTAVPAQPVSAGSIQRYTQLRRGRDQEIAVFLCQPAPRVPPEQQTSVA
jgi:hypothetical protein